MAKKDVPGIGEYGGPAGGWGALQAVAKAIRGQMSTRGTPIMIMVGLYPPILLRLFHAHRLQLHPLLANFAVQGREP
jgi:hypothetical protein